MHCDSDYAGSLHGIFLYILSFLDVRSPALSVDVEVIPQATPVWC